MIGHDVDHKKRLAEYPAIKKAYLEKHPVCVACWCAPSFDVHHSRGRTIGSLLVDQRYFKALCRRCHDLAGNRVEWAREKGVTCEDGKWNVQDE